jgi:hypothetical protein
MGRVPALFCGKEPIPAEILRVSFQKSKRLVFFRTTATDPSFDLPAEGGAASVRKAAGFCFLAVFYVKRTSGPSAKGACTCLNTFWALDSTFPFVQ